MNKIYFEYDRSGKMSRLEDVRPKGIEGYNVWQVAKGVDPTFLEFATLADFNDLVAKYVDQGYNVFFVNELPEEEDE